jgi:hypothetical protein
MPEDHRDTLLQGALDLLVLTALATGERHGLAGSPPKTIVAQNTIG